MIGSSWAWASDLRPESYRRRSVLGLRPLGGRNCLSVAQREDPELLAVVRRERLPLRSPQSERQGLLQAAVAETATRELLSARVSALGGAMKTFRGGKVTLRRGAEAARRFVDVTSWKPFIRMRPLVIGRESAAGPGSQS
jgi:hypothetical protein